MKRILLVEDDPKLSAHLDALLRADGLCPLMVTSADELESVLTSGEDVDLILLDRLLGGMDTRNRLGQIKRTWPQAPVLVLSAINTPAERAEMINLGVDDYMGKPFSSQELLARLKALGRRFLKSSPMHRVIGNTAIDIARRTISVGEHTSALTTKEFLLLRALAEDPGRVISRDELLDTVWGINHQAETNVVEATMASLRRRLESIESGLKIRNIRNSGYWLAT